MPKYNIAVGNGLLALFGAVMSESAPWASGFPTRTSASYVSTLFTRQNHICKRLRSDIYQQYRRCERR
jgi:hypothetical protein